MFLPVIPRNFYYDFSNTFGLRLAAPYWDRMFGFDVIKFDEFIQPEDGESTEDAIRRKYGDEAVKLVNDILNWERDQFEQRNAP